MKKHLTLLWVFFFIHFFAFSQCPENGFLHIQKPNAQETLDSFLINYPNCTKLDSILIDNCTGYSSLDALSNIDSITGDFILGTFSYEDLAALNNLKYVGGDLSFTGLSPIIDGLPELEYVGGDLRFWGIHVCAGDIFVNNQPLDGFTKLKEVKGDLVISGNDYTEINGFDSLTRVEGDFIISGPQGLKELNGFENLENIGECFKLCALAFYEFNKNTNSFKKLRNVGKVFTLCSTGYFPIESNFAHLETVGHFRLEGYIYSPFHDFSSLKKVDNFFDINTVFFWENSDFNALEFIGDYMAISENDALIRMPKFAALDTVIGSIRIKDNQLLQEINDINNLKSVQNIEIENNPDLFSIDGLTAADIIDTLVISDNDHFDFCAVPVVCNHLEKNGAYKYEGPSGFCSDVESIQEYCSANLNLSVYTFYDANQNQHFDNDEVLVQGIALDLIESNSTIYSSQTNPLEIEPSTHQQSVSFSSSNILWQLTTDSTIYRVNSLLIETDSLLFGVFPSSNGIAETNIIASIPSCESEQVLEVTASIKGTDLIDGTLWFELDNNIDSITFIDIPDIIDGNKYGWHFVDLSILTPVKKQLTTFLPSEIDLPTGTNINNISYIITQDSISSDTSNYQFIHGCDSLKQDKIVSPSREDNAVFENEKLTYTIRFSNSSYNSACDILVIDTLSESLDISTFEFISSSHEEFLQIEITDNSIIRFNFNGINLDPFDGDITKNNAFLNFSIYPKSDIKSTTEIINSANIFFDLSQEVKTNSTLTILLFDLDGDGFDAWEDCDDDNPDINPGTEEIPYNDIDDDCNTETPDDDIDQDGFPLAEDCDDKNPYVNPGTEEIPYNGIDDDCDTETLDDDLDQDGFPLAEDCDDENSNVNPGNEEIPYNGTDDDCDTKTLDDDLDQDGFPLAEDCDDENENINPDAEEIPGNDVDENCDGVLTNIENLAFYNIKIYPNPTAQFLYIESPNLINGKVILYNHLGQSIYNQLGFSSINMSDFSAGVYYLMIENNENKVVFTERIVYLNE